jgi:hypothetical protein
MWHIDCLEHFITAERVNRMAVLITFNFLGGKHEGTNESTGFTVGVGNVCTRVGG